jgi:hypothetical protein
MEEEFGLYGKIDLKELGKAVKREPGLACWTIRRLLMHMEIQEDDMESSIRRTAWDDMEKQFKEVVQATAISGGRAFATAVRKQLEEVGKVAVKNNSPPDLVMEAVFKVVDSAVDSIDVLDLLDGSTKIKRGDAS